MGTRAVDHFVKELELLILRTRQEYELTYAEAIGCLELTKFDLIRETNEEEDAEE